MKRIQVDVTAEVLAKRRALEKEYLDAGYMVPLPTRKESRALQGIPVYESRDVQPSNSALYRQRKKNPRSVSKRAGAVKRTPTPKPRKKNAKRAAPSWGIFAKRNGKKAPRMFFSGDRLTNNGEPTPFASSETALTKARELLSKFPKLAAYRVTVEKIRRKRNP